MTRASDDDVVGAIRIHAVHSDPQVDEEQAQKMHAGVRNIGEITSAWKELRVRASVKLCAISSERHHKAMVEFMYDLLNEIGDRESHPLAGLLDVVAMFVRDYDERKIEMPEAAKLPCCIS